jgi:hypothetical protein
MTRILKFIFFVLILYIFVVTINAYDTKIMIELYTYKVEASLFFLGFIFIIFTLSAYIILRIIYNFLGIPALIYRKYVEDIASKEIDLILNSYAGILMSSHPNKDRLEAKLKNSKYKQHIKFMLSVIDDNIEHKIIYLTKLSQIKEFAFYSYSKLMKIMLQSGNYEQALIHANNALFHNKNDIEINCFLIQIYAKLFMWDKLEEVFFFLQKQDDGALQKQRHLLSKYLTIAAKSIDDNRKIKNFLELSLRLDSSNIEALELFCEINTAINNMEENKLILDEAFVENPSFQIFLLYKKYTNIPSEKLYDRLLSLVDLKLYPDLFFSIKCDIKFDGFNDE